MIEAIGYMLIGALFVVFFRFLEAFANYWVAKSKDEK